MTNGYRRPVVGGPQGRATHLLRTAERAQVGLGLGGRIECPVATDVSGALVMRLPAETPQLAAIVRARQVEVVLMDDDELRLQCRPEGVTGSALDPGVSRYTARHGAWGGTCEYLRLVPLVARR